MLVRIIENYHDFTFLYHDSYPKLSTISVDCDIVRTNSAVPPFFFLFVLTLYLGEPSDTGYFLQMLLCVALSVPNHPAVGIVS